MLFGDSYKRWFIQLSEYCRTYKQPRPSDVVKCRAKWISYGGLKWCSEDALQTELDNEMQGREREEFKDWMPLTRIERRTMEKHVPDSRMNSQ